MVQTLTPQEMNALLVIGEVDVVDIRDTQEWSDGHIPGARLVPLDDLRADPAKTLPRSNIVFVCGQGLRSLTAAKLADRLGIGKVYSLDGGISNWTRAGLQLVPG
ncbi:MAG TPA: rhodanese-like domain-containing protein [Polyangia bacterium]